MVVDFERLREQRHALELLEDLNHQIVSRPAEGQTLHYDKDGKLIKGEGRVLMVGLEAYQAELRERAGLPPEAKAAPKASQSTGVEALNQLAAILGQRGIA